MAFKTEPCPECNDTGEIVVDGIVCVCVCKQTQKTKDDSEETQKSGRLELEKGYDAIAQGFGPPW